MSHLSPINGLVLVVLLVLAWLLYRLDKKRGNKYSFVDILMGPNDRASMTNHILLLMVSLFTWVVVDHSLYSSPKPDSSQFSGLALGY